MKQVTREIRGLFGGRERWVVAVGSVVLALGGTILLRAPSGRAVPTPPVVPPAQASATTVTESSGVLSYTLGISQSRVVTSETAIVGAEVRLNAGSDSGAAVRAPVALAVVLDVSGSMSGEKIDQAKDAVSRLVERMHPEDQLAFVTYNHTAQVVQPLTPVSAAREVIPGLIKQVFAGGGTAIPPALTMGVGQLAGAPPSYLRRVVLVSDGLDGSGQALPAVVQQLEHQSRAGTYLSSLGIGVDYDEQWLTSVADAGRGNYAFLASGAELTTFLRRELDETSRTVVDQVIANVVLPNGFRVRRSVGASVPTSGTALSIPIGPMFAGDERKVVLELEGDASALGTLGTLSLDVQYRTVQDGSTRTLARRGLALESVGSGSAAADSRNPEVHARTTAALLELDQAEAMNAWRRGDGATAQSITERSLGVLRQLQATVPSVASELAAPAEAFEDEGRDYERLAPSSTAGRGFGLRAGAARRARSRR